MRPFQYWNFPKLKNTFHVTYHMAYDKLYSDFQSDYVKRSALMRLIGFPILWFHVFLIRPEDFFPLHLPFNTKRCNSNIVSMSWEEFFFADRLQYGKMTALFDLIRPPNM